MNNILWFHSDSHDGRAMGCMGLRALAGVTPAMDGLARDGVLFANTYCPNPICCPSRAAMVSGKYTFACEGWNNHKGLEPGVRTLFDEFADAGELDVAGKTDWLSGGHTVRARVTAWTRDSGIDRPAYRMGPPRVIDDDRQRVHERDWQAVERTCAFLAERGRDRRPFVAYIGTNLPHPEFTTSRYWLERIAPNLVDRPPYDRRVHQALAHRLRHLHWEHGLGEDTVRLVRRIYWAMIAETDHLLGRALQVLEENHLTDDTVVVYSSDHGELAMEHDSFYKMSAYEPAVRVPLIVRGPGVQRGRRVNELANLVDLHPTFCELLGRPRWDDIHGESLVPFLRGRTPSWRDWAFSECHDTGTPTGMYMLRRGDWKYVAWAGMAPQLFNLAADPWEIDDLASREPARVAAMDGVLGTVLDYRAVDRKVKRYGREAFTSWRTARRAAGDYDALMARTFSGWDHLPDGAVQPWTAADEALIEAWLARAP